MNDYKELIEELRSEAENMRECRHDPWTADDYDKAADAIEQLVKERDAAVSQICQCCDNCKHRDAKIGEPCISCSTYRIDSDFIKSKWEWRGVQE